MGEACGPRVQGECQPRWADVTAVRPLCANINETLTAAIITEQGGKENHRE